MMREFVYERLDVYGAEVVIFDVVAADGLRQAVAHLEKVGRGKLVWLRASMTAKIGNTRVPVSSMLSFEQVDGKSDDEIWQMLDRNTEMHIHSLIRTKMSTPYYYY